MFEVGLFEMLVIGVVALVVLGPERLPVVARTAGHLIGRFRRYANQVKSDITREMQVEEFNKMKSEIEDSARGFQQGMQKNFSELESDLNQASMHEADRLLAEAEQRRLDAATATELEYTAQAAEQAARADAQAIASQLAQSGDVKPDAQPPASPTSKATDV